MPVGFAGQDPRTPFGPQFLTTQNTKGNNFGNIYGTGSGYDAIQQHYGSMAQLNPMWDQWIKMAKAAGGGDISFGGPARSSASLDPNATTAAGPEGSIAGRNASYGGGAQQTAGQQMQALTQGGTADYGQQSGDQQNPYKQPYQKGGFQGVQQTPGWYDMNQEQRTNILGGLTGGK